jgi:hypothetical protein
MARMTVQEITQLSHAGQSGAIASLRKGDRFTLANDSNRIRRVIATTVSPCHFETACYVRPSKGYRKHIRRMKANG